MQLPNWIELDGRLVNLDNICFISKIKAERLVEDYDKPSNKELPERTSIAFIGGATMEFNLTRDETIKLIETHYKKLAIYGNDYSVTDIASINKHKMQENKDGQ